MPRAAIFLLVCMFAGAPHASAQQSRPKRTQEKTEPATHADVKYGPHNRNVMDVWLAKSSEPTPVLVSIHGGGFRSGNKSVNGTLLNECLKSGISVVAITYRLTDEAIARTPFRDSARAVQFIRSKAKDWNLDSKRMAASGGSAGAGISLWLGFHDDLADPNNTDPVLRESTRLTCMAVYNGQTSYDPRFINELFPETKVYQVEPLTRLFGIDLTKPLENVPDEKLRLFEEVSPLHFLTKDDAPALLTYATKMDAPVPSPSAGIHHARFGAALKKKMDELGIECDVRTETPMGTDAWTALVMQFLRKHFGMKM